MADVQAEIQAAATSAAGGLAAPTRIDRLIAAKEEHR
jgi:hypothetical protein